MVKRVSLVRRKPGMSRDAFIAHWLGPHADIIRTMERARGYVINVIDDPELAGWDGIAEMWFDSREAAEASFSKERIASLLADDRPNFIGEVRVVFVEEHTVL